MMRNSFIQNLESATNFARTENGAIARLTTSYKVYDMFATGAAYRKRSDEDCILLFKRAYEESPLWALKCLFYIRNCRGGQGERRYFRVCYNWFCKTYPEVAKLNLPILPEFGRWDDLIYATLGTPVEKEALALIKSQLTLDVQCKTPSLLAKWLPSENASALETKKAAKKVREFLGCNHRQYRKTLSILRERIKVLEKLMSENRWDEIKFDKIPSKAGIIYKNAFARRDIIAKKYEAFAKSSETKVNAATLYPYDVVSKAITRDWGWGYSWKRLSDTDRAMINKYWDNLPDYLNGAKCNIMCVVDTSGSMTGSNADAPLNVALGLGMYCAERLNGPFKNKFITFSNRPQFIEFEGVDFVDKVRRVYSRNECSNTNLLATFDLLRKAAMRARKEDIPEKIVVISDMQIDQGSYSSRYGIKTEMEQERARWAACGLKMPSLIYWNVRAASTGANFLDDGPDVTYVSGASPSIFKQVLTGKTGLDLMYETLGADVYKKVKIK